MARERLFVSVGSRASVRKRWFVIVGSGASICERWVVAATIYIRSEELDRGEH